MDIVRCREDRDRHSEDRYSHGFRRSLSLGPQDHIRGKRGVERKKQMLDRGSKWKEKRQVKQHQKPRERRRSGKRINRGRKEKLESASESVDGSEESVSKLPPEKMEDVELVDVQSESDKEGQKRREREETERRGVESDIEDASYSEEEIMEKEKEDRSSGRNTCGGAHTVAAKSERSSKTLWCVALLFWS